MRKERFMNKRNQKYNAETKRPEKKRLVVRLGMMTVVMLGACGCAKQTSQTMSTYESVELESVEDVTIEQSFEESYEISKMIVYYPDLSGRKLGVADSGTVRLSPEAIMNELAIYEVVPEKCEIVSFSMKEEKGKILYLNLTKEYKDFLEKKTEENDDGYLAEQAYLYAMVNTFLDAYHADGMRITIEGGNLNTAFSTYDDLIVYSDPSFVLRSREQDVYEISDCEYTSPDGTFYAVYPQFRNVENGSLLAPFNQLIQNYVEKQERIQEEGNVTICYETAYQSEEQVSLILRGENQSGNGKRRFVATFNFDFTNGTVLRLKDISDLGHIIECLELGSQYSIEADSQVSSEQIKDYLSVAVDENLMMELLDYDFELGNDAMEPAGFSYVSPNGEIVLCLRVPEELGDYVELRFQ